MTTTITATWRDQSGGLWDGPPYVASTDAETTQVVGTLIRNGRRIGWHDLSIRLTDADGRVRMLIRPRASKGEGE